MVLISTSGPVPGRPRAVLECTNLGEEAPDRGSVLACAGDEKEVAVVDDVQLRVADECHQHPGVDQRHDRVVGAGHHERRLAQQPQPRQAGPAQHREQLVQVAAPVRHANVAAVLHK